MNETLRKIYNACDPTEPASAEFYLDCSPARGDDALTGQIARHLGLADDYVYSLFSGHIGCGKSSELEQLKRTLAHPDAPVGARYFAILLNVSDYLDDFDVDVTDILLAIVSEVAASLREVGIELKDSYFSKRFGEIKEFFLSDIEINEGEVELPSIKLKVQRLKKDAVGRKQVRSRLERQVSSMVEAINLVFERARLEVKKMPVAQGEKHYSDIVLILDNLEKIQRFADKEGSLNSQQELFLERYALLTGMQAHMIYTVPLRLVRSSSAAQLAQRYSEPLVLPMVKVRERGGSRCDKGIDFLRELLLKRMAGLALSEVFTDEALNFLLTYSGGHVRNLMTFVQNACSYVGNEPQPLPLSLSAAEHAVRQTVRLYSSSIPDSHWAKLAQLHLSLDQSIVNDDEDYMKMLENLSVLEYINGDVQHNAFEGEEPWYAVNPIVQQLRKFKAAVTLLEAERQTSSANS